MDYTITPVYRSTKPSANLSMRICFRLKSSIPKEGYKDVYGKPKFRKLKGGRKQEIIISEETKAKNKERYIKDMVVIGRTNILVTADFFKNEFDKKLKDAQKIKENQRIKDLLNKYENALRDELAKFNPETINTAWVQRFADNYYNPNFFSKSVPDDIVGVMRNYVSEQLPLDYSSDDNILLKKRFEGERKKINSLIARIEMFEELNGKIFLMEIDENLRDNYLRWGLEEEYSKETIRKDLVYIRKFAKYAAGKGKKVSAKIDNSQLLITNADKVMKSKIQVPYLSFEKLEILKNLELPEYLKKARDWLYISAYLGQRISDFSKFKAGEIITEDGKKFIKFNQEKTTTLGQTPILPQVEEILERNGGDFPPLISDQKYNKYIKEVCKIAKFDEILYAKKKLKKSKAGHYKFHELVTSHIGRRSFSTNFYGKVPTAILMSFTRHSTEKEYTNYVKSPLNDRAKEIFNYINIETVEEQLTKKIASKFGNLTINEVNIISKRLQNYVDKNNIDEIIENLSNEVIEKFLKEYQDDMRLLLSK